VPGEQQPAQPGVQPDEPRGAAKRTGFLYLETLSNQGRRDSWTDNGVPVSAPDGTEQRLCPFLACGAVADYDSGQRINTFCYVDNDDTRFFLTVAYDADTGGPLTGGFMDRDDMNSFPRWWPAQLRDVVQLTSRVVGDPPTIREPRTVPVLTGTGQPAIGRHRRALSRNDGRLLVKPQGWCLFRVTR
jgi:hypothetical protein